MFFASSGTSPIHRQYPFLKELGLSADINPGVYRNGEWIMGKGATIESISPHSGQVIGTT